MITIHPAKDHPEPFTVPSVAALIAAADQLNASLQNGAECLELTDYIHSEKPFPIVDAQGNRSELQLNSMKYTIPDRYSMGVFPGLSICDEKFRIGYLWCHGFQELPGIAKTSFYTIPLAWTSTLEPLAVFACMRASDIRMEYTLESLLKFQKKLVADNNVELVDMNGWLERRTSEVWAEFFEQHLRRNVSNSNG